MTDATVVPITSALAPEYVADMYTCGGVTFGYFAIGNVTIANKPMMLIINAMTIAKIGLWIKNFEITRISPYL